MSYMDRKNILNEGFFKDWLKTFIVLYGAKMLWNYRKKKKVAKKLNKDNTLKKQISNINKDVSDIEKYLSKEYGFKVDLDKYEISDFK